MDLTVLADALHSKYINEPPLLDRDYFALIKELVILRDEHGKRSQAYLFYQKKIAEVYDEVMIEVRENKEQPTNAIKFGTSGWRGIIGKDINAKSVGAVAYAIVDMYHAAENSTELAAALGVSSLSEAQTKGCVLGYDNRFANNYLAGIIMEILSAQGFTVKYAGEATTGTLSAAVLGTNSAFSINLTPSHNPLQYGGFKFNAADAGPAAPIITDYITSKANEHVQQSDKPQPIVNNDLITSCDALGEWKKMVRQGVGKHGLDYDKIIDKFSHTPEIIVVIDSVHGASRIHVCDFFKQIKSDNLIFLRKDEDPTFGGIAPEPSSANMTRANEILNNSDLPLRLGVIMDPDADRIRFSDGRIEISMNQFGAMAYHFLHDVKGKRGMAAKTVATSNFANAIAKSLGEEVFEPKVGFKEFKPVIGKALVCFEESDGISIIGHTPEKDAYIGLLLALDMVMTLGQNLGDYLDDLQNKYGCYYPDKDGIEVSQKGDVLNQTLAQLDSFKTGDKLQIGDQQRVIKEIINIDGHKFILDDDSWLMIRPSGTEPKVRFYVEARSKEAKEALFNQARNMLKKLGLLEE